MEEFSLEIYAYFILGIILGLAIAVYIFVDREEKIQKEIELQQRIFSTRKLNEALDKAVKIMQSRIATLNRELTEEEKDNKIGRAHV